MKNKFLVCDFNQKLDSTFVRFRGKIYWARIPDTGNEEIWLFKTSNSEKPTLKINGFDEDLDISSIPLGYFNYAPMKVSVYVTRCPFRKVKQGVSLGNTETEAVMYNTFKRIATECLLHESITEGFDGKYPTINTALSMMDNHGWHSVAICDKITLTKEEGKEGYQVLFKKEKIGTYNKKTNTLTIPPGLFSPMMSKFVGQHRWIVE